MKYKKSKARLNEMHEFYLLVKFGFVLIYIWNVYRKKSYSILSTKKMFNSLLVCFLWKTCTFSNFERLLCWKSRNYSQHCSLEIFFKIFSYQTIDERELQKTTKEKQAKAESNKGNRSYSERVRAKWFCFPSKLGFLQLICQGYVKHK